MERRTFLTTVGVGATAAAAGCLSRATSSDDPENESSPGENGSDLNGPGEADDEKVRVESETTDRRTIGSGSLDEDGLRTPHAVALANRTEESVDGTFAIRKSGAVTFEKTAELEPDAVLSVSLTDFARYEVEASIPDADAATTETVDLGLFDCNGSQTTIDLQPDGTLESSTVSTAIACLRVVEERVPASESVEHVIGGSITSDENAGDAKHALRVENPTGETWTARAQLFEDSEAVFDGAFILESGAEAVLPIAESADYELLASVLETGATARESVGAELFDCNTSSTTASVDANGELDVQTISTMIACDVGEED